MLPRKTLQQRLLSIRQTLPLQRSRSLVVPHPSQQRHLKRSLSLGVRHQSLQKHQRRSLCLAVLLVRKRRAVVCSEAVLQKQKRKAVAYLEAVVQVKAAEASLVAVQAKNLAVFSAAAKNVDNYVKDKRNRIIICA